MRAKIFRFRDKRCQPCAKIMPEKSKAVFLDRDGVINEVWVKEGKVYSPLAISELKIMPETKDAAEALVKMGFTLVIFTNQPEIARGNLNWKVLNEMNEKVKVFLGGDHVIRGIYVCPHDQQDGCECRKPKPGLLYKAASDLGINLSQSFVIGDRDVDIEAGEKASCKTIVLDRPYNRQVRADYRAKNIPDAVRWIEEKEGEASLGAC